MFLFSLLIYCFAEMSFHNSEMRLNRTAFGYKLIWLHCIANNNNNNNTGSKKYILNHNFYNVYTITFLQQHHKKRSWIQSSDELLQPGSILELLFHFCMISDHICVFFISYINIKWNINNNKKNKETKEKSKCTYHFWGDKIKCQFK